MQSDHPSFLGQCLHDTDTWPEFLQAMYCALGGNEGEKEKTPPPSSPERHSWLDLPGICCLAAGGNPATARPFSTAWFLLYAAAHILDDVEDQDTRLLMGQNVAINAATGLYASSGMILNHILDSGVSEATLMDIQKNIQNTILLMCSAQHKEFTSTRLNLEEVWQIAEAKSGSFFALACYGGAKLAGAEEKYVAAFSSFGRHLGLLIQLANDVKDIADAPDRAVHSPRISIASIPVAYTFSVADAKTCEQLREALEFYAVKRKARKRAKQIMKQEGAGLYLMANIEKQRSEATEALQNAAPGSPVLRTLQKMITDTAPIR